MLDVSHDSENGEHEHELRVRAAREALVEQGAPEEVVEEVVERLGRLVGEPAPVARTVVASPSGVLLDEVGHFRVDSPVVGRSPLPDLARWIEHQDGLTPFVLAVVDDEGGDVAVCDSDVPETTERVEDAHALKDRLGMGTAVATGVDEITDAFVRGQVDTLLLDPQAAADLTVKLEEHPGLVLPAAGANELPADQALVAAAVVSH